MRVVIDTNVIVSGMISPHGPPAQIITLWLNGAFTLLFNAAMFEELTDVLNRAWLKKQLADVPEKTTEFLTAVAFLGEEIPGYVNVSGLIRDPFDEMFLICAQLGHADFLVSGDQDLLSLDTFYQTRIVTPTQFLNSLSTS